MSSTQTITGSTSMDLHANQINAAMQHRIMRVERDAQGKELTAKQKETVSLIRRHGTELIEKVSKMPPQKATNATHEYLRDTYGIN